MRLKFIAMVALLVTGMLVTGCALFQDLEADVAAAMQVHVEEQAEARSEFEEEVAKIYADLAAEVITLEEKSELLVAAEDARAVKETVAMTAFTDAITEAGKKQKDRFSDLPTTGNGWLDLLLGGGGIGAAVMKWRNLGWWGSKRTA